MHFINANRKLCMDMRNVNFAQNATVLKDCKIKAWVRERMHGGECMLCSEQVSAWLHYFARYVIGGVMEAWRNLGTFHVVVQTTVLRKEIYLRGRLGGSICEYVLSSKYTRMVQSRMCDCAMWQREVSIKSGTQPQRNITAAVLLHLGDAYSIHMYYKLSISLALCW